MFLLEVTFGEEKGHHGKSQHFQMAQTAHTDALGLLWDHTVLLRAHRVLQPYLKREE